MSIDVKSNPDGSYTITCGSETIVVGGTTAKTGSPPGSPFAERPIHWPAEPDDNPGGVRAYMCIDPISDFRRPFRTGIDYRSPQDLKDAIRHELSRTELPYRRRLEVRVFVDRGYQFSMYPILMRMEELADEYRIPSITLRLVSRPGGSGQ
jgi:hypothetical protein